MATTEVLRTQLDTLRIEKQLLEVENARLRESNPDGAALADTATEWQAKAEQYGDDNERLAREIAQLKTLCEQLLHDSQEEQARAAQKDDEVAERQNEDQATIARLQEESSLLREREAECERWKTEVEGLRVSAELECHRAVAAERQKWEAREERMLEQQQLLEAARAA